MKNSIGKLREKPQKLICNTLNSKYDSHYVTVKNGDTIIVQVDGLRMILYEL